MTMSSHDTRDAARERRREAWEKRVGKTGWADVAAVHLTNVRPTALRKLAILAYSIAEDHYDRDSRAQVLLDMSPKEAAKILGCSYRSAQDYLHALRAIIFLWYAA